ncbi:hypothetical protein [Gynuella sunshinyii]|uniref:Diaminohydroxyphosphoribosylaminopyrimidine deaminase n=1 Tax=Gynuella sunshinyii YC6258 TaxID=1445510 RepID=A0A0C5VS81_9GAMM|nr:hypothetical protein [Gynuella sunshinyii]AJQ97081.1 hypothetical Protein YC6258_05050 [Gynuella sunshinyii YC6258]
MFISEHITNALNKAKNLSPRSGIAWVLLDRNRKLLCSHATTPSHLLTQTLIQDIKNHSSSCTALYLSLRPSQSIMDVRSLVKIIDRSVIEEIYIGHDTDTENTSRLWIAWSEKWSGSIHCLPHTGLTDKLALGIEKGESSGLPWLNAVTAANFYNASIELNELEDEFGFLSYLNEVSRQSQTIICSQSQKKILPLLPATGFDKKPLNIVLVDHEEAILPVLKNDIKQAVFSTLIFCDMQMLAYLLNEVLVDEITFHTKAADPIISDADTALPCIHSRKQAFSKLNDWQLQSSSIIGNCNQIRLFRSHSLSVSDNTSETRLN